MAEPDRREATDAGGETLVGEGSRTIRRNVVALGAGQMFTWAMTLAWTLVVPRLLGAGGMGIIITGMSVVTLLQIAMGGGTALYVTREIVVAPDRAARIVASASIARLMLVPVFGIAIVVVAQLAHYGARQDEVLYLCGAATALMLVGEPLLGYFQATERMHYMAIGDGINKASQGLAGIVLAVIGFGAIGFAACWVVTAGVVVVLSVRWARRYVRIRWRTTWVDLKDIVRGSATYWTGGLFFTIYAWIDTVMLSLMTNPTVVGWYGVPMRLWGTFLIIPSIALRVFLPRMVAANERSRGELNRVARVPIELVCILSLPVATAIAVSAAPVVHLVYGPSFAHAVPVLIILGLNLVPMYLNMMLGSVCVAAKRQGTWNWVFVGATVFNPAVNAILIPLTQRRFGNGAIGAAIALALTETLVACVGVAIVGRGIVGLSTARRVGRMALACCGMWLVVHLLGSTGPVVSLLAGCIALFVLAIVFSAVTKDEQRQIRGFAERLTGRAAAPLVRLHSRLLDRRFAAGISSRVTSTVPPTHPRENGANVLTEPSAAPGEPAPIEV
jgi:O-antigen/teichoic acid export membrane protein